MPETLLAHPRHTKRHRRRKKRDAPAVDAPGPDHAHPIREGRA